MVKRIEGQFHVAEGGQFHVDICMQFLNFIKNTLKYLILCDIINMYL